MTPKEKAKELVEKMIIYHSPDDKDYEAAKDCALIAVDEILDLKHIVTLRRNMHEMELEYWDEVKQEIEKL
jgi:hypothetical protein